MHDIMYIYIHSACFSVKNTLDCHVRPLADNEVSVSLFIKGEVNKTPAANLMKFISLT